MERAPAVESRTSPRPKGLQTSGERAKPLPVPAGVSSRENLSECFGVQRVTLASATDADAHVYMRRLQMSIVKDVKRQTGKPECPITLQAAACFGKRVIESRGGRRRTR
jgi:hypothetical protein